MKTLFEYEQENRIIINMVNTGDHKFSTQEFEDLKDIHGFHRFDFKSRIKWLNLEGYEVNRDNVTNESLPSQKEVAEANDAAVAAQDEASKEKTND